MRRGFPITKAMQAERRKRAEERNAEYEKLTLQQKLDKLPAAPKAAKQRAKLQAQVEQTTQKAEAAKVAATAKAEAKAEKSVSKKGHSQ